MDTPVSIKITQNDPYGYGFETEFEAGGEKYLFAAFLDDSEEQEFEVVFSRVYRLPTSGRLSTKFDVMADMDIKSALAVFSGVKKSLEAWLHTNEMQVKPPIFYFSAKELDASRVKLYDKFAKMIARKTKFKLERKSHGKQVFYSFSPK
jgi:hypothetical protein